MGDFLRSRAQASLMPFHYCVRLELGRKKKNSTCQSIQALALAAKIATRNFNQYQLHCRVFFLLLCFVWKFCGSFIKNQMETTNFSNKPSIYTPCCCDSQSYPNSSGNLHQNKQGIACHLEPKYLSQSTGFGCWIYNLKLM